MAAAWQLTDVTMIDRTVGDTATAGMAVHHRRFNAYWAGKFIMQIAQRPVLPGQRLFAPAKRDI